MLWTIIIIIAILLVIGILFRMVINFLKLGWLIKLVKFILFAAFVLTIVFGYFLIKDTIDFKNNFTNSTNAFILKSGTTFLAGIQLEPNQTKQDKVHAISNEILADMQKNYIDNKIPEMREGYYKVIIFDMKAFDDLNMSDISVDKNTNITKTEAKKILLSSDAKEDFAQLMSTKQNVPIEQIRYGLSATTSEDIKGYLFASLMGNYFNPKNSKQLIIEMRNRNIAFYEETFLFKSIHYIPDLIANELNVFNSNSNAASQ